MSKAKDMPSQVELEADQLHAIIKDGDYEALLDWISRGRPLVFSDPRHPNRSTLVEAAWTGFYSVLKALLNAYDWHLRPKDLDGALIAAMKIKHRRCVNLLLDYGADPDAVDWWLVYESNDGDILRRFLMAKKDLGSFACELGGIGKPLIGAIRATLPHRPDMDELLVEKALHCQTTIQFGFDFEHSSIYRNDEKDCQRAKRNLALLLWAGVNPRLKIHDRYEGEVLILRQAIKYCDVETVRKINPTADDLPTIVDAVSRCYSCNETMLKILQGCGFVINDRADGSSTAIRGLAERCDHDALVFFAAHGARLPDLGPVELRKLRNRLAYDIRRNPGKVTPQVLSAYRKILSKPQQDYFNRSSVIDL